LIDHEGNQLGIIPPEVALQKAIEEGLDLVEVAPNANPPVCRIIDFGKFKYEQEKMAKEARKKQTVVVIKEIRMRPHIEEHDYQVKLKSIIKFLEQGDKVKVTLMFKGREMSFMEKGRQILDRIIKEVEEFGGVEKLPNQEGRIMIMTLIPHRKGKK